MKKLWIVLSALLLCFAPALAEANPNPFLGEWVLENGSVAYFSDDGAMLVVHDGQSESFARYWFADNRLMAFAADAQLRWELYECAMPSPDIIEITLISDSFRAVNDEAVPVVFTRVEGTAAPADPPPLQIDHEDILGEWYATDMKLTLGFDGTALVDYGDDDGPRRKRYMVDADALLLFDLLQEEVQIFQYALSGDGLSLAEITGEPDAEPGEPIDLLRISAGSLIGLWQFEGDDARTEYAADGAVRSGVDQRALGRYRLDDDILAVLCSNVDNTWFLFEHQAPSADQFQITALFASSAPQGDDSLLAALSRAGLAGSLPAIPRTHGELCISMNRVDLSKSSFEPMDNPLIGTWTDEQMALDFTEGGTLYVSTLEDGQSFERRYLLNGDKMLAYSVEDELFAQFYTVTPGLGQITLTRHVDGGPNETQQFYQVN